MNRPIRMVVRFLLLFAVLALASVAMAPPSGSHSPYLSALSDLAASPTLAAHKHCANSACEFVAPAFTCLGESPGTKCVRSTSGCQTTSC